MQICLFYGHFQIFGMMTAILRVGSYHLKSVLCQIRLDRSKKIFLTNIWSVYIMSTKKKWLCGFAVLGLLGAVGRANAHHAFSAEFDAEKPIEVKGVITKFELVNPHSWLYIDVKQPDGSLANWGFEFGAPFNLKEKGITKKSLTANTNTEVTIQGFRAKNGQNFGYAVTTVLPDGRSVKTGGAQDAPAAADEKPKQSY